jgi:hypothetical protein
VRSDFVVHAPQHLLHAGDRYRWIPLLIESMQDFNGKTKCQRLSRFAAQSFVENSCNHCIADVLKNIREPRLTRNGPPQEYGVRAVFKEGTNQGLRRPLPIRLQKVGNLFDKSWRTISDDRPVAVIAASRIEARPASLNG